MINKLILEAQELALKLYNINAEKKAINARLDDIGKQVNMLNEISENKKIDDEIKESKGS